MFVFLKVGYFIMFCILYIKYVIFKKYVIIKFKWVEIEYVDDV